MMPVRDDELSVINKFVGSFEKLNDMVADEHIYPITWELAVGDRDQYGNKRWRPAQFTAAKADLEPIYSQLPGQFPRLYEELVLSYRWAEVDLEIFTLLANPPGSGLTGLLHEISKDPVLWISLREAGYVQFGKGPDLDYDPVCFDIKSGMGKGTDYRIVKIDHEEILCHGRVKIVGELAPSFEKLALATIDRANVA
jgi:hypothetical protein